MFINKFSTLLKIIIKEPHAVFKRRNNNASKSLIEIGHFEQQKSDKNERYDPGQLFVHKLFGYRGIILFPWFAQVVEMNEDDLELKSTSYYYQVLVDLRDRLFLSNFTQFEAVTYLESNNYENGIRSLPGMAYVAHEDVMPFTPTAEHTTNIQHELLDNFFTHKPLTDSGFSANNRLKEWEKKSSSWLVSSKVYKQTSEEVQVTAIPFYIGYQKTKHKKSLKYWWRYQIRLENFSDSKMQLQYHYWRIFDSFGMKETVFGKGVVGLAPTLCRRYPIFQYNSHVSLNSPNGHMWGTYILEKENGEKSICNIPLFVLDSKINGHLRPNS